MNQRPFTPTPNQGPHVVVIGGGHGLSNMLRGLKQYTTHITAIVTVSDNGGGSGHLRNDLGMPPPGDIRNCLEALANAEPLMTDLMAYRFQDGRLAGQSFGNLFLAALNGISPSFDMAVRRMSQVLAITGEVLPVTTCDVQLSALFENGNTVVGECELVHENLVRGSRIEKISLLPQAPEPLPQVLQALTNADMIVLGPGSLYTSVIPNLLVPGIVEAMDASNALKVYICNVMTQPGETEGYTASDHIRALFAHAKPGLFDLSLGSGSPIPKAVAQRYALDGATPIQNDVEACAQLGVELLVRPMTTADDGYVRHHALDLAQELMLLHAQRHVRIAGRDTKVYQIEN